MKALHQVLRDLDSAARQGVLTPSFLDGYARRHGEGVLALYARSAAVVRSVHAAAEEDGRPAVLRRRRVATAG